MRNRFAHAYTHTLIFLIESRAWAKHNGDQHRKPYTALSQRRKKFSKNPLNYKLFSFKPSKRELPNISIHEN